MPVMSSWFPVEAELLGSLWVGELPPCNFWTQQLISHKFEQWGGDLKNIRSYKLCENDMTK